MCLHLYICLSEACFFGSEGMRLHSLAYAPDAPTSDASRPAAPASMVAVIFVLHCPETVRCLDENLERKGQRVFLTLCWQWALCERHNENCERRYMADEDACVRMYRRHRTSRGTFTPDSFTESESDMLSSASSDVFWGISPRSNLPSSPARATTLGRSQRTPCLTSLCIKCFFSSQNKRYTCRQ